MWKHYHVTPENQPKSKDWTPISSYDLGLYHSYSIIPWYLCQRLWSGNRSSCQRQTFCPDITCLSAGHRCNLLAQTFRLTIRIFSHVHVKGESRTYFVWVTRLCWLPWITYGTECLFLITGKNRKGICLIRKLKKKIVQSWVKMVGADFFLYMAGLGFLPFKLSFTVTWTRHRWKLLHRFHPGK